MLLKIFTFLLPWGLRRLALQKWFGYQIHPSAHIGLSWIFPRKLIMEAGSKIGALNVAIHLDFIEMGAKASIARGNWITGFPSDTDSKHFRHQVDRFSALKIGECAAITKNHHFDCTSSIQIGRYTTIAGYGSQFLTHSIDVFENRQDSKPITVGEYAFVGTDVVLLGGAGLPSYSVLGAKSLLNKQFFDEWMLYGGVPAKPLQSVSKEAKYFSRLEGFVF